MNKRVSSLRFGLNGLGICQTFGMTTLQLCMASFVLSAALPLLAASPAKPVEKEESVLVATREDPPSATKTTATTPEGNVLQPTAESSDNRPELAAGSEGEDANAHFGEALAKVAETPKHETVVCAASQAAQGDADQAVAGVCDPGRITTMPASQRPATARFETASSGTVPFEAVKFQGISVGKTTQHELITAWGQAADTSARADGEALVYRKSPFRAVEVLIGQNGVVSTINIALAAPLESKRLAEQLSLEKLTGVTVTDDAEKPIGLAFPERGVLFIYATAEKVTPIDDDGVARPESSKGVDHSPAATPLQGVPHEMVSHVVIQPLDAKAFMLRAEKSAAGGHSSYTENVNDLKTAIALDPEYAYAYCLLAKNYLTTGQADLADAAAAEACEIEPKNAAYQLCRAQTRELLGEYDDAVLKVRAVLDREDLSQIDRAQALHQMAGLASLGDGEIASKTIPFENRAIEAADKLATSKDGKERRAARQILVEAHVAIAEEVARQAYNQKVESLKLWIGRASGLAEDYIAKDGGSVELRLFIAQRVLASLASFRPTLDPAPWVAEADEAAKILLAQSDDELWQQHVKWELGIAYLNALRVEHTRRQTDMALKYGQAAIDNLAVGASCRQSVHSSEQLVGQLYFQMGAVYAVHKLDHAKASQWYDKAAPLLTGSRPASELYAPRREGEMLVSMGVSYWQLGNQTRALDLTQTGVGLVEAAVENGVLAKSTLAVPYGNLATMYEQMGETANATKYQELAKSVAPPESKQPQRIGRGKNEKSRAR